MLAARACLGCPYPVLSIAPAADHYHLYRWRRLRPEMDTLRENVYIVAVLNGLLTRSRACPYFALPSVFYVGCTLPL